MILSVGIVLFIFLSSSHIRLSITISTFGSEWFAFTWDRAPPWSCSTFYCSALCVEPNRNETNSSKRIAKRASAANWEIQIVRPWCSSSSFHVFSSSKSRWPFSPFCTYSTLRWNCASSTTTSSTSWSYSPISSFHCRIQLTSPFIAAWVDRQVNS